MSIPLLFQKLEEVLSKRCPEVVKLLRPGLAKKVIERRLKKVTGLTQPLYDLYSWHDGTEPRRWKTDETYHVSFLELSFFPQANLHFLQMETAVGHFQLVEELAKSRPALKSGVNRYFPMFWDGSMSYLSLDIDEHGHNEVFLVDMMSTNPFKKVFPSFELFLHEAVKANETGEALQTDQSPARF